MFSSLKMMSLAHQPPRVVISPTNYAISWGALFCLSQQIKRRHFLFGKISVSSIVALPPTRRVCGSSYQLFAYRMHRESESCVPPREVALSSLVVRWSAGQYRRNLQAGKRDPWIPREMLYSPDSSLFRIHGSHLHASKSHDKNMCSCIHPFIHSSWNKSGRVYYCTVSAPGAAENRFEFRWPALRGWRWGCLPS